MALTPDGDPWAFQNVIVGVLGQGFGSGTQLVDVTRGLTGPDGSASFDLVPSPPGTAYVWSYVVSTGDGLSPTSDPVTFVVPATGGPFYLSDLKSTTILANPITALSRDQVLSLLGGYLPTPPAGTATGYGPIVQADGTLKYVPQPSTAFVLGRFASLDDARKIGAPEFFDNFQRSDRNVTGDVAPSGHVYARSSSSNPITITGGKWVSPTATGSADISYVTLRWPPTFFRAKWRFRATPTGDVTGNCVIGAGPYNFGSLSIQLSMSRTAAWLEYHGPGVGSPYPHLGSDLTMSAPLVDGQEYEVGLYWDQPNSAMTIMAPDGGGGYQFQTITDARINAAWGRAIGLQSRRAPTSGYSDCTWVEAGSAAGAPAHQPVYAASPRLDGGYIRTGPPVGFDPTKDLELITYVTPDQWAPGGTTAYQTLAAIWPSGGDECFRWVLTPDGKLGLYISQDGTAGPGVNSPVLTAAPGVGMWARVVRTVADGAVQFYASTDAPDTAAGSVSWTAQGAARSTPAGALHLSVGGLTLGITESVPDSWPLIGVPRYARLATAGTPVAEFDPRRAWSSTGNYGNAWKLIGAATWVVDVDSVPGLRPLINQGLGSLVTPRRFTIIPALSAPDTAGSGSNYNPAYLAGSITGSYATSGGSNDQTWTFADLIMEPGTWALTVIYQAKDGCGIMAFAVDGAAIGSIDAYSATTAANLYAPAMTFPITTFGRHNLVITNPTKNAASSNFQMAIQSLGFRRTGN